MYWGDQGIRRISDAGEPEDVALAAHPVIRSLHSLRGGLNGRMGEEAEKVACYKYCWEANDPGHNEWAVVAVLELGSGGGPRS